MLLVVINSCIVKREMPPTCWWVWGGYLGQVLGALSPFQVACQARKPKDAQLHAKGARTLRACERKVPHS